MSTRVQEMAGSKYSEATGLLNELSGNCPEQKRNRNRTGMSRTEEKRTEEKRTEQSRTEPDRAGHNKTAQNGLHGTGQAREQ